MSSHLDELRADRVLSLEVERKMRQEEAIRRNSERRYQELSKKHLSTEGKMPPFQLAELKALRDQLGHDYPVL